MPAGFCGPGTISPPYAVDSKRLPTPVPRRWNRQAPIASTSPLPGIIAVPRAGAPFLFAALTVPAAAAERVAARPATAAATAGLVGAAGFAAGAMASVAWDWPFSTGAGAGVLAVGLATAVLGGAARALLRRGRG